MSDRTIWKFPLGPSAAAVHGFPLSQEIFGVPWGAYFVHVGQDPNSDWCLWAEVDRSNMRTSLKVFVIGTGHEVPEGATYLASIVDGPFVWHVYTAEWR